MQQVARQHLDDHLASITWPKTRDKLFPDFHFDFVFSDAVWLKQCGQI